MRIVRLSQAARRLQGPIRSRKLFALAKAKEISLLNDFAIQNSFYQLVTSVGELEGKERHILL